MTKVNYKIAIIGGGAVGLTFASLLAEAATVLVKTRRQEQADLLKSQGISLAFDDTTKTIKDIDASANMADIANCDAVIITVKSYDTEKVAQELSANIQPGTPIVTLQNGIQALEILRNAISKPDRIFAGVTYIGASRSDDRSVKLGANRRTIIDSNAGELAKILKSTRFDTELSGNSMQAVWDKMVLNVGQNALSAITNFTFDEMLKSEQCLTIAAKLLGELEQVANAEGVEFDYVPMDALKDNWINGMPNFRPSMWQDLHLGRRTEIDALNGAISQLGKKHGLATPYNGMITDLVKAIEKP